MATKYAVEYANGHRDEFTASQCHQAKQVSNYDGTRFFLADAEVTGEVWFAAVHAAIDAAWDKKNQTHKRVRVLHGTSVACYVEKWVRR